MFKSIANMASLMRQASQMGERMQEFQARLRERREQGASGGGLVQVEVNGLGEVLRLSLDPLLVERGERDVLEDLIPAALNDALTKARDAHAELMRELAGGLQIPGLDAALAQFTGRG